MAMLKQTQKINFQKLFADSFYYLVLTISIVLFLFAINLAVQNFETGRDIQVFCRAGVVISNGQNPYLTSELELELSWNYPSILAYAFHIPCTFFNFEQNYILPYILFFVISLLFWLQKQNWFYGIALCATGLFNLGWVMITGNLSTIEFLLFSLSAFLLFRNKINASVFLFGLMASMKLIPILYLPAFLFLQNDMKKKITTISWAMIGFLSLPLLSLISSPHLFPFYLRQLFGLIPNQHNPLNEFTPIVLNQSLSVMILSFLGLESQLEKLNLIFSLVIYALGIFALYIIFKTLSKSGQPENKLILFSFGIIILTIFMPRLKPYSFLPALLCFYLISREQSALFKSIYLILLSIVPTVLHLIYFYTQTSEKIFIFHQISFLCLATIVLVVSTKKKHKPLQEKMK